MRSARSVLPFLRTRVLPRLDKPLAVLLVGSFADGYDNRLSDVDLIAITRPRRRRRFRAKKKVLVIDGRVVVTNYFTAQQLRRSIGRLGTLYRSGRYLLDRSTTRLAQAVVVHDSGGLGKSLVQQARRYRVPPDVVRHLLTTCLGFHEDALGNLMERDPETAVLVARQAATVAVDCFLLTHRTQNLKLKWHIRRLRATGAGRILSSYRQVLGLDSMEMKAGTKVLASLDRLICEIFQVRTILQCDQSPLITRARVPPHNRRRNG